MVFKIAVLGSAMEVHSKKNKLKARILGEEIAKSNNILISGATIGLPNEAVIAANKAGGITIGYSPAKNRKEHVEKYNYPITCKKIIYTGKGVMGRNYENINNADACIFIEGGIGTLNEFTIAYRLEKVVGVLTKTGGICDMIKDISKVITKKWNCKLIYDDNPKRLVKKVLEELK